MNIQEKIEKIIHELIDEMKFVDNMTIILPEHEVIEFIRDMSQYMRAINYDDGRIEMPKVDDLLKMGRLKYMSKWGYVNITYILDKGYAIVY